MRIFCLIGFLFLPQLNAEPTLGDHYPLLNLSIYSLIKLQEPLVIPPKVKRIYFYNGYPVKEFRGFPFCEIQVFSDDLTRVLNPSPSAHHPFIILGVGEYKGVIDRIANIPKIETYNNQDVEIHEVWLATDSPGKFEFRCVGRGSKNTLTLGDFRQAFGNFLTLTVPEAFDFFDPSLKFDKRDQIRKALNKKYFPSQPEKPTVIKPLH